MKNIDELIVCLTNVGYEPKALWGKMSFQHMIEHLTQSVRISNGKLTVACNTPEEKLPTLKRILMSERPLPKNFINPIIGENLLPLEYSSIEEAISALRVEINDYKNLFKEKPESVFVNPTFGSLNKEEWEVFHRKHFQHHLSQFGLV